DFEAMNAALKDRGDRDWSRFEGTQGTLGTDSGGSAPDPGGEAPRWDRPVPFGEPSPPPGVPLVVLPATLPEHATHLADAPPPPPDAPAMLGTACAAAGCAKKFRVRVRPGWVQPLNLYVAVTMAVGERKTSVSGPITAPAFEAEEDARRAARDTIARAQAE